MQTFMVPRGGITYFGKFSCSASKKLTFVALGEMSQQLSDGLL